MKQFITDSTWDEFAPWVYQTSTGEKLNVRIHIPDELSSNAPCPLVLFLHGAGERGNDNLKQLNNGALDILRFTKRSGHPAVIVAPQCPAEEKWVNVLWDSNSHIMPERPADAMRLTLALLQQIILEMPVDPNRIYVTGLSMGGFATWDIIQRSPGLFAAAIPICGGGDPAYAPAIKDIPIQVFHGDSDPTVKTIRSREMIQALENAGGHPLYTEYPDTGHDAWTRTYRNAKVLEWLFAQRRA